MNENWIKLYILNFEPPPPPLFSFSKIPSVYILYKDENYSLSAFDTNFKNEKKFQDLIVSGE